MVTRNPLNMGLYVQYLVKRNVILLAMDDCQEERINIPADMKMCMCCSYNRNLKCMLVKHL